MPVLKPGMAQQLNQRISQMSDSKIRRWHQYFQSIPGIIDLSVGEPNFAVSSQTKAAIQSAIEKDESHYSLTQGFKPLRDAVSKYVQKEFDAPKYLDTETLITVGATEGIYASLQALFNPGDVIVLPTPTYPLYAQIANSLGLQVVKIDTSKSGFKLTPDTLEAVLEAQPKAKGFIFNDPTNPTGVAYSETEVHELAKVLSQTNICIITDEIYGALTYDIKHVSMAKFLPSQTVIIGGLSKSHAMTGYRIGFVLGPEKLISAIAHVHQLVVGSTPTPLMVGSISAINDDVFVEEMRQAYLIRRNRLIAAFEEVDLTVIKPSGAFYLLLKIPANIEEEQFVIALAENGVGVIPGSIFDIPGYVRLSFATSDEELEIAIQRIKKYMTK